MKKVIALFSIVLCFAAGSAMAQGGGGGQQMTPEQRMAALKERLKPLGLTDVQNDSVVAIYSDRSMMAGMNFRDMSPEDRASKMKEVSDVRQKRMLKAGLSAEAAGKVVELMSQRPGGGGGGGGRQ
jgi:hypothetical protein